MSAPINDGGPAFPVPDSHYPNGQTQYGASGMSLRDWFAGQAMTGFISASTGRDVLAKLSADMCYQMADAMLAARERKERST